MQDIAMRFERNSLRRVQLVEQELFTLPEHMSSQPVGFCCVFCSFMCSVLWTIVVLSSISFYHRIVCPLIHDFWLCLRFFLRSFLNISPNYENMFEEKCLWETCVKIWFALAKRCFNTISAISIMAIIFTSGGHQSAWKKQLTAMIKLKHCFEK
jgi:hypothetical protein